VSKHKHNIELSSTTDDVLQLVTSKWPQNITACSYKENENTKADSLHAKSRL